MAFKRNEFIVAAKKDGYSDEEINAELNRQGEKPIGTLEKIISSKAIPWVGAGVGALAGSVTPLTPIGGAMAGYGGAYAGQQSALDLLGKQTQTPKQQLQEGVTNTAIAGTTAGTLWGLGTLLNPGKARENAAAGKVIPRDPLEEKLLATPEKAVSLQSAKKTSDYASSLYQKAFPYETTPQGTIAPAKDIDLNKFYKLLDTFEKETKTYSDSGKSIPNVEAGRVSLASRQMANEYGGKAVQALNDYMRLLHKAEPYVGRAKSGVAIGAGYFLFDKFKKALGF